MAGALEGALAASGVPVGGLNGGLGLRGAVESRQRRRIPVPDVRTLAWLFLVTLVTGLPLLLWFDADAQSHAEALGAVGLALRALHGASAAVLVLASVAHLVLRVVRGPATGRGVRTGALALLAVGLAGVTGAMAAQTAAAQRLLAWSGLAGMMGEDAVAAVAVVHVAFASLVALAAVLVHAGIRGGREAVASTGQAAWAVAAVALAALVLGASVPGDGSSWRGGAWVVAPPVPVLWLWTVVVGLAVYALWPFLGRGRGD